MFWIGSFGGIFQMIHTELTAYLGKQLRDNKHIVPRIQHAYCSMVCEFLSICIIQRLMLRSMALAVLTTKQTLSLKRLHDVNHTKISNKHN